MVKIRLTTTRRKRNRRARFGPQAFRLEYYLWLIIFFWGCLCGHLFFEGMDFPDDWGLFANVYFSSSSCKYDGNCPIGEICNKNDVCVSYLGIGSTDPTRLDACVQKCLEELRVDERYLHESSPEIESSYRSSQGGCVLHYQRKRRSELSKQERAQAEDVTSTVEDWIQGRFRRVVRVDPSPNNGSNMWMAYCHDPCQTQHDCSYGFECRGRQTSSNPLPIKSCERPLPPAPTRQEQIQDMYVVTGANFGYFSGLRNFAASLQHWSPKRKLIVYNLGMTEDQLGEVQTWPNVHRLHWKSGIPTHYPDHVRNNLKNYAWKPIIINETVHEYKSIFWLDAGATFTGPVEPIEEILHRHGLVLMHGQDDDMVKKSHPSTYEALGYNKTTFRGGPHCAGGIQGHVYPSRYIDSIVIPNAECALDKSCIAPNGSSLGNHRFDQTTLSILAYDDRVQAPHYTELLASSQRQLNKNLSLPSSRYIIWTARSHCRYYSNLLGG